MKKDIEEEGYTIWRNPAIANNLQHRLEIGGAMSQVVDEYHFYALYRNQLADWYFSQFLALST